MVATLVAERRTKLIKSQTKKYRQEGKVPGILYGRNVEATPLVVDRASLQKTIREHGRNALFRLSLEGENVHDVIIQEIQRGLLNDDIIHVDFFAVDKETEIDTEVPIRLTGEAKGQSTGVVMQLLYTMSVRTLPANIPEEITIDISLLDVGDSLHVKDVSLNSSIKILNDPEETIVTIVHESEHQEPGQEADKEGEDE